MTKYGILTENQLHPAPRAFMLHGAMVTNPKAEHFAALNEERAKQGKPPYLPVRDEPPTCEEGYYSVATGWESYGGAINRVYEVRELPTPPPRTFDKYKLVDALITAGVWDYVEAWLKETPYAWLRVQMAPDISEDEPLLAQGIAAVKELLGWTDEQVAAVLDASAI